MSDAFSAARLAQLEERWRKDPESRVFLQLAEEYRRGGMMSRAVETLEQGVARHPNQVSALVALGRCRLEVDDAPRAVEAFEQALTLDPAQLVANRMLVEAYLRTRQPAKAGERLAFYRLFNDSDPEIEGLERRIAAARPAPPRTRGGSATLFDLGRKTPAPRLELGPARARRAEPRAAEPFGRLHGDGAEARDRILAAIAAAGVFPVAVEPEPPVGDSWTPGPAALEIPETAWTPEAPEPAPAAAWWVGGEPAVPDAVEPAEPVEAAAALPAAPGPAPQPPWGTPPRPPEALFEARDEILHVVQAPFSPRTIGEEVEREMRAASEEGDGRQERQEIEEPFAEVREAGAAGPGVPPPVPAPRPPAPVPTAPEAPPSSGPTATLGELYLTQGYLDDAETEFRRVLEERPSDAAARAGLDEVARRRAAEDTASGWSVAASASAAAPRPLTGLTQRKIGTLRGYLDRLRRGRERAHVS